MRHVREACAALLLFAPGCVHWGLSREFFAGQLGTTPPVVTVVSGSWQVARAEGLAAGMPALQQTASSSGAEGNLCFVGSEPFSAGALQVQLKPIDGAKALGGGLVWNARGASHYLRCDYDAIESKLRLVRVSGGQSVELASATVEPKVGWHTLRLDVDDDRVACQWDGIEQLKLKADALAGEGQIGLWTAQDAQSQFADFVVVSRR